MTPRSAREAPGMFWPVVLVLAGQILASFVVGTVAQRVWCWLIQLVDYL